MLGKTILFFDNVQKSTWIQMLERWQSWSIASDLKSDESHGSEGSNPSLSFLIYMYVQQKKAL